MIFIFAVCVTLSTKDLLASFILMGLISLTVGNLWSLAYLKFIIALAEAPKSVKVFVFCKSVSVTTLIIQSN